MSTPPRQSTATPEQWPDLAGRQTRDGGHVLPVRVYYEDTDVGGVVYHAAYLRFCERARSDWLRLLGIHHGDLKADDGRALHFVVRRMECDFLCPARLDDVLEVRTQLVKASRVRLLARQAVHLLRPGAHWLQPPPQTGPIFSATVTVAVIDDSGRPARLPQWAMRIMQGLQGEHTGAE